MQALRSISFILKVSQPKDIVGNELLLIFKYKFHKDRIDSISIKNIVEKVISEVYETPIKIKTSINENLEVKIEESGEDYSKSQADEQESGLNANNNEDDEMLSNLLKNFGGRIIE